MYIGLSVNPFWKHKMKNNDGKFTGIQRLDIMNVHTATLNYAKKTTQVWLLHTLNWCKKKFTENLEQEFDI